MDIVIRATIINMNTLLVFLLLLLFSGQGIHAKWIVFPTRGIYPHTGNASAICQQDAGVYGLTCTNLTVWFQDLPPLPLSPTESIVSLYDEPLATSWADLNTVDFSQYVNTPFWVNTCSSCQSSKATRTTLAVAYKIPCVPTGLAFLCACRGSIPPAAVPVSSITSTTQTLSGTCVLLQDGDVSCWGSYQGPRRMLGMTNVTQLTSNLNLVYALLNNGTVVNTPIWNNNAVQIVPNVSMAFSEIGFGDAHGCGVNPTRQSVYCWGQFGYSATDPFPGSSSIPILMPTLPSPILSLHVGRFHTCVRGGDGKMYCWGSGPSGELGNGAVMNTNAPVVVSSLQNTVGMSIGNAVSCAIASGTLQLYCWGLNFANLFQDGNTNASSIPKPVQGMSNVNQVKVGYSFVCVQFVNHTATCWGRLRDMLIPRPFLTGVRDLSVSQGNWNVCFVFYTNIVKCWGTNDQNQVGEGASLLKGVVPIPSLQGTLVPTMLPTAAPTKSPIPYLNQIPVALQLVCFGPIMLWTEFGDTLGPIQTGCASQFATSPSGTPRRAAPFINLNANSSYWVDVATRYGIRSTSLPVYNNQRLRLASSVQTLFQTGSSAPLASGTPYCHAIQTTAYSPYAWVGFNGNTCNQWSTYGSTDPGDVLNYSTQGNWVQSGLSALPTSACTNLLFDLREGNVMMCLVEVFNATNVDGSSYTEWVE
jgi:hypothetical protein